MTVYQVWNRGQLTHELNASGQVINKFYIGLEVNHTIKSRHHGFYLFNFRGDVVQRTDDYGNVIYTYRYDAFGNQVWPDGLSAPPVDSLANNNPIRFAGEYWDWERGEYYLRARSFNPRLGRFTQPDPFWGIHNMLSSNAAILQSGNLFVYVMNNPVRFVDPWGLMAGLSQTKLLDDPIIQGGAIVGGSAAFIWYIGRMIRDVVGISVNALTLVAGNIGSNIVDGFTDSFFMSASEPRPPAPIGNMGITPGATALAYTSFVAGQQILYPLGGQVTLQKQMQSASSSVTMAVAIALEDIARRHGLFECDAAANAMAAYLAAAGLTFQFAEIWFSGLPGDYDILVRTRSGGVFSPGQVIGRTGWHVGILHSGRIFCNVHPLGMPGNDWFNDFTGAGRRKTRVGPTIIGPW